MPRRTSRFLACIISAVLCWSAIPACADDLDSVSSGSASGQQQEAPFFGDAVSVPEQQPAPAAGETDISALQGCWRYTDDSGNRHGFCFDKKGRGTLSFRSIVRENSFTDKAVATLSDGRIIILTQGNDQVNPFRYTCERQDSRLTCTSVFEVDGEWLDGDPETFTRTNQGR